MKRKDELRDIYQAGNPDFEKDFTPQVAQEIIEQRQRDLFRSRIVSMFFGGLAVILSVVLVAVAIRDFLSKTEISKPVQSQGKAFIPRHSLSSEAVWVINYKQAIEEEGFGSEEEGEKPLSTKWVKKAAYHIIMGQQALAIGEPDEALEHFNDVVKIFPEIEGIHRVMGTLYIQKEQYDLAANHLELALQEEESFETINNLGTAYIGTKDYDAAEKYLKRALELQPESPICHKNLAVLYRDMERNDDAMFHFEKYLDLRPDDIETMQTYALFLTSLGRWQAAADFLEKLTTQVTDIAPIYFLLAQVQVQNGQQDKAIAALKRGIQLVDPTLALAWMNQTEFNTVRESPDFKKLVDELEIASVSLDNME
ncbi:tetratricopeptide repeat protein [Tichowtungia aerotolerans]|uniref:Tetratricopeptide repeat protein n=1 Tax=Tichowtungia aerotolerans TaxID=2697043 RepID=A0A6P1M2P4_9BACT|nr:tetratricopeptide repeat protein [Tichowtungia aerotolerans]QHI68870.1 tetratricopeptide repeat protein [Tichowtungia aerotolerans]